MADTWFTADLHRGHANIVRYCSRPFATVGEMDQAIFEQLNASVKANDTLYFLGDCCMGSQARVIGYRRRIRCKKIFAVPGNHDKQARKLKQEFSWLDNLAQVSIRGQLIVLCHYALHVWNRSNHGSWHLYGHSHGRLSDIPNSLSMDVGVDTHDFRPWHYDEIANRMRKKSEAQKSGRHDRPASQCPWAHSGDTNRRLSREQYEGPRRPRALIPRGTGG